MISNGWLIIFFEGEVPELKQVIVKENDAGVYSFWATSTFHGSEVPIDIYSLPFCKVQDPFGHARGSKF